MIELNDSLIRRFSRYVGPTLPNGCQVWVGFRMKNGYGNLGGYRNGRWATVLAHRVAYLIAHGSVPDEMDVLHSCDNRGCVNSEHLFLGTAADNVADMLAKGRGKRSKITESDLSDMLLLRGYGVTMRVIAKEYGISRPMVSLLLNGHAKPSLTT